MGASQAKQVAIRSCKACRERKPKGELQRWVLGADGTPQLDTRKTLDGRGAYVCSQDCYNKIDKQIVRMLVRRPAR